jgi:hypothetical protein
MSPAGICSPGSPSTRRKSHPCGARWFEDRLRQIGRQRGRARASADGVGGSAWRLSTDLCGSRLVAGWQAGGVQPVGQQQARRHLGAAPAEPEKAFALVTSEFTEVASVCSQWPLDRLPVERVGRWKCTIRRSRPQVADLRQRGWRPAGLTAGSLHRPVRQHRFRGSEWRRCGFVVGVPGAVSTRPLFRPPCST